MRDYLIAVVVGLVISALIAGAGYALYEKGYERGALGERSKWSIKWERRNKDDTAETLKQEQAERAEETRRKNETDKIIQEARHEAIKAESQYYDAVNAGEQLQRELRAVRRQLATSETGRLSAIAGRSYSATEAASLLARLYAESDRRAGEIARFADEANRAGLRCEQIYNAVASPPATTMTQVK